MKRIQHFEIGDLDACPPWLLDYMRDYLHWITSRTGMFADVVPVLAEAMEREGETRILDLCSGGRGPTPYLVERLRADHQIEAVALLTDLRPSRTAQAALKPSPQISYHPDPVDVMAVPEDLKGVRTIIDALHHFPPDMARRILADASARGQSIVVVEGTKRSLEGILPLLFVPLFVLLITPFLRPFEWRRIVLTYIIPLIPLTILHDGVVSALRTYTEEEWQAMTTDLDGLEWRTGHGGPQGIVSWLVGLKPRPDQAVG